jgi:hypothetical protein
MSAELPHPFIGASPDRNGEVRENADECLYAWATRHYWMGQLRLDWRRVELDREQAAILVAEFRRKQLEQKL